MSDESSIPTNCDNCGACCMGQNLLPLSGAMVDQQTLPAELETPLLRILHGPLGGDDDCPCVWLDRASGKCQHYEYRPSTCRDMVVGEEACIKIRRKAEVT